jgi:hemerythrin-like metal-binding protein
MLTWDPHLSVNIATIDEQHKKLIEMACELDRGMRADYATDILQPQFRQLLEFASLHFRTEEDLMERYTFPGLVTHRHDHLALIRHAEEIMERTTWGKPLLYMMGILDFIGNMLINHIQRTDREYSTYLNERGVF